MALTLINNGKTDWTNYQDYWREEDAEWLQARTILRYATSAARTTDWTATPLPGQTTYNAATDQLEHAVATTSGKWVGVLASQHLKVTPNSSASDTDPVVLGHRQAGNNGIQFWPTVSSENKIALPAPSYLDIGGGAIVAKAAGLTLHTGVATVTLTTDADSLVSSAKITAPNAAIGVLNVSGLATLAGGAGWTGTLAGTSGSVVNATSGTIGSVNLASAVATASSGFVSQQGYFFGSSTLARIRQRDSTTPFALGAAGFDISDTVVTALGTDLAVNSQMKVNNNNSIDFYLTTATLLGHLGPVVVSATTPTVANYPEGTIWVTP